MNIQSKNLYVVDPDTTRVIRWLRQVVTKAIYLYWELFVILPVILFTQVFAAIMFLAAVIDLVQRPAHFPRNLPVAAMALAPLIIPRVREFLWALLGCFVLWLVVVVAALLPFLGEGYQVATTLGKVILSLVYFLPPAIAALYVDHFRHRKT